MFQAGISHFISIPMWSLLNVPSMSWSMDTNDYLIIAGLIMFVAFVGETVADQQLYRFKQNPKNHGKTMDQGYGVFGIQTISLNGCIGLLIQS